MFTEVVVAPGFEPDALARLRPRRTCGSSRRRRPPPPALDLRPIDGGFLVQDADRFDEDRSTLEGRHPARRPPRPSGSTWSWPGRCAAAVTSNTIVLAKDGQAFGIGAGQQNRVDAGRIAAEKAAGRARGGVCASDAFFPFRDGLDAAAAAGAAAVIQPGGSVRDDEVIAAADEHGIAMVFTGERHFRH